MKIMPFSSRAASAVAVVCLLCLPDIALASHTFDERAAIIIDHFSTNTAPDNGGNLGKYAFWYAEARFHTGDPVKRQEALTLVDTITTTPTGSMFYRWALMDCYLRYNQHYSQSLKDSSKTRMTSYTGYGGGTTKNHWVMLATARYLAQQTWPGETFASNFRTDDPTGEAYLFDFMEDTAKWGLAEHDSTTYHVFYLGCLRTLADLATDPVMKQMANLAFEHVLASAAPEWLKGYWIASSTRSKGPMMEPTNAQSGIVPLWLYFGGGPDTTPLSRGEDYEPRGCWTVQYAVSTYRVPAIFQRISAARASQHVHRESGKAQSWEDSRIARKTSFVQPDYGVFSMRDSTVGGSFFGDETIRWGVRWVSSNPNSTFTLQHPVATRPDFESTTSYQQVLQSNHTVISTANIPSTYGKQYLTGPVSTTSIYKTVEQDTVAPLDGWIYFHGGTVLIAVKFAKPYTWGTDTTLNDQVVRVLRSDGLKNGFVVETAPASAYALPTESGLSLEERRTNELNRFITDINTLTVDFSGIDNTNPVVAFTSLSGDTLSLTSGGNRVLNGVPVDYDSDPNGWWPLMRDPWMSQRMASSTASFGEPLAVFEGTERRDYNFDTWTATDSTYSPSQVIIDNQDAGFSILSGTWTLTTARPNGYNTNYYQKTPGTGTAKVRWTPTFATGGYYTVYYWLPDGASTTQPRTSNARFKVVSAEAAVTYLVDQRPAPGGVWMSLGTHYFNAGSAGYVELNDKANANRVIADAVKFVAQP